MNVVIDGVKYVPAKEVVVNREVLLRALVELFWGDEAIQSIEWFEKEASTLAIMVTDVYVKGDVMVSDFLDTLGEWNG